MLITFAVLIILTSIILGLIVLVQNPKGGGLSGSIAGFSNQFMGVKQTTDVLEKGTWVFAAIVAILCIISPVFITNDGASKNQKLIDSAPANLPGQKSNTVTMPGTSSDSIKK